MISNTPGVVIIAQPDDDHVSCLTSLQVVTGLQVPEPEPEPPLEGQALSVGISWRGTGPVMGANDFKDIAFAATTRRAEVTTIAQNASAQISLEGWGDLPSWTDARQLLLRDGLARKLGVVASAVTLDSLIGGGRRRLQDVAVVDFSIVSTVVDISCELNQMLGLVDANLCPALTVLSAGQTSRDFTTDLHASIVAVATEQGGGRLSDANAITNVAGATLLDFDSELDYTLDIDPDSTVDVEANALLGSHQALLQGEITARCDRGNIPGCVRFMVDLDTVTDCVGSWSRCGAGPPPETWTGCLSHYFVTMDASQGGQACTAAHGNTQACVSDCGANCLPGDCPLEPPDLDCVQSYSSCTIQCELGPQRTSTVVTAQSGAGVACPITRPDCEYGEDACVAPVNCASFWSVCAADCTKVYTITQQQAGAGSACQFATGVVQPCAPGIGNCQQNVDCDRRFSACTELCETSGQRTVTEVAARSGQGAACPAPLEDCTAGMDACENILGGTGLFEDGAATKPGENLAFLLTLIVLGVVGLVCAIACCINCKLTEMKKAQEKAQVAPNTVHSPVSGRRADTDDMPVVAPSPDFDSAAGQLTQQVYQQPHQSTPRDPQQNWQRAGAVAVMTGGPSYGEGYGTLDLTGGGGGGAGPGLVHVSQDDVAMAEDNLREGLQHLEANDFNNALLGCNLAICGCAPALAGPQRPPVLTQSMHYKLAVQAYKTVQTIAQQQKQSPHTISPEVSRRQVLLCIFLCTLEVQPRHRVRFMRRTIQLSMRCGNWGLAALYLETLIKYAKANRGKLEAELQQCHDNQLMNTASVPPELSQPGASISMTMQQAVNYLEQAEQAAGATSPQDQADDRGSLAVAYHLLGTEQAGQRALECCKSAMSLLLSSGGSESSAAQLAKANLHSSLCLCHHGVGDTQSADGARDEFRASIEQGTVQLEAVSQIQLPASQQRQQPPPVQAQAAGGYGSRSQQYASVPAQQHHQVGSQQAFTNL